MASMMGSPAASSFAVLTRLPEPRFIMAELVAALLASKFFDALKLSMLVNNMSP